ncbi:Lactate utilization protein B [Posidoniimonas polymericola]|uniref:Lactate utilization protein B n=1 Tax=Posidoniimonas polymericola TaxID=2528002 RepID=A0A5C5YRT1_9BACT|nr:LutB/LldF family L-lactate oxidation iron-sulfur protein [Posidoniimonas polymericola]TWT77440.1 Lactate utilization protein B [Posidoniimonas polymericola]
MSTPLEQFQHDAAQVAGDGDQRQFLRSSLSGYVTTRRGTQGRFQDYTSARAAAAEIKWNAIENLDKLLPQFADNLEARGVKVHWCRNGDDARKAILGVIHAHGAKSIVKSKCMTTEEIHLNELLENEGFEVVESDLGEFIVQLRGEAPYHFVFPAMHLKRGAINKLFKEKLKSADTDDPEQLTMIAREVLRQKYLDADVGISGANFGVAETGMISITENEGNARLTTAMPKVHIAVMGIEKVIPKLDDLALLLPLLATAGTGQHLTGYNSQLGGPRQAGEVDGPEEMHVVLLDNHRTRLLADQEQRDALRCIRCGACLNVCPIFKNVGGHTYGTTYQGPIGSVITPHLRGLSSWKHLSDSSSLCGACTETCPVQIDLHHHLLRNRRNSAQKQGGVLESLQMRIFSFVMRRPWLYGLGGKLGRIGHVLSRPIQGTKLDPLYKWRATRDFPDPAAKTFKEQWKERRR